MEIRLSNSLSILNVTVPIMNVWRAMLKSKGGHSGDDGGGVHMDFDPCSPTM